MAGCLCIQIELGKHLCAGWSLHAPRVFTLGCPATTLETMQCSQGLGNKEPRLASHLIQMKKTENKSQYCVVSNWAVLSMRETRVVAST